MGPECGTYIYEWLTPKVYSSDLRIRKTFIVVTVWDKIMEFIHPLLFRVVFVIIIIIIILLEWAWDLEELVRKYLHCAHAFTYDSTKAS